MSKLVCLLLLTAFSATFADQELENFAQNVLGLLNPNSASGNQNSILLSLTNGEHLTHELLLGNSSHSLSVNVTFSGTVTVSAQRDNKKIKLATKWDGGAGLVEKDKEGKRTDNTTIPKFPESPFLDKMWNEIVFNQKSLDADETAVLLAHGADTGVGVRDNTRKAEAKLRGGFVVGSTTKVTKNF